MDKYYVDKYYTPKPKEFCIGFEYESLQDERLPEVSDSWQSNVIEDSYELELFLKYYNHDLIANLRVKYLNKEDIEDLGFSYDNNSNSFKIWEKYKIYELVKNSDIVNIIIYRQTKMTAKELPFSTWEEFNIFNGVIKNKSELRKLLSQLSII